MKIQNIAKPVLSSASKNAEIHYIKLFGRILIQGNLLGVIYTQRFTARTFLCQILAVKPFIRVCSKNKFEYEWNLEAERIF